MSLDIWPQSPRKMIEQRSVMQSFQLGARQLLSFGLSSWKPNMRAKNSPDLSKQSHHIPLRKEAALRMMGGKDAAGTSCSLFCASCANLRASGQDARTDGLEARAPLFFTGMQFRSLSGDFQPPWMRRRLRDPLACVRQRTSGRWGAPRAMRSLPPQPHKTWTAPLRGASRNIECVCRFGRARPKRCGESAGSAKSKELQYQVLLSRANTDEGCGYLQNVPTKAGLIAPICLITP